MKKSLLMLLSFLTIFTLVSCAKNNNKIEMPKGNTENNISNNDINNTGIKFPDAKDNAGSIVNKTIEPSDYLDYSVAIEKGIYKWVKSDDGTYYTLCAVDSDGKPITKTESAINVGANNQESIDNGKGNIPQGERPEGKMQGGRPEGMQGGGGMMRGGGMMGGMFSGGTVYQGIYMNANITNLENQTMLIYAPKEYFDVDNDGNVIGINHNNTVNGYTADTAPIIYANECGGWKSSSPRSVDTNYIKEGFIHVTAGARSRDAMDSENKNHTGKAPTQMVDLKSGVIELRANRDVIPGDTDKIISIGTSGGGQMSSILGASGDMKEYYEYMYEAGTLGITKNADGSFSSVYKDSIFAAQNYCPIADIEYADIAYAWWWVDLVNDGGVYGNGFTDFEKRLQELEAEEYIKYLNSLNLTDEYGNKLSLTGLREGTYYDAILRNISNALNKMVASGEIDPDTKYGDYSSWLTKDKDGNFTVTDMRGFMIATGLVNNRNKAIPGFDAKDKSAENNAFGKPEDDSVHFSRVIGQILKDNNDELSKLDGYDKEVVDAYINDTIEGADAEYINRQTALLNATHIMLGADGIKAVNPAQHFRNRSGTADQHTSFSVGYNIMLSALSKGSTIDYSLVWDMPHGSNEGTSTGTFIEWVNSISK